MESSSVLLMLKSAICEEFFPSFLNSLWSKYSVVEKNLGLKVKSSLSDMTWKYGKLTEAPRFFESPKVSDL